MQVITGINTDIIYPNHAKPVIASHEAILQNYSMALSGYHSLQITINYLVLSAQMWDRILWYQYASGEQWQF